MTLIDLPWALFPARHVASLGPVRLHAPIWSVDRVNEPYHPERLTRVPEKLASRAVFRTKSIRVFLCMRRVVWDAVQGVQKTLPNR